MNIFFSYVPFQYTFLFTKALFFILAIKVLDPLVYSNFVKSNIAIAYTSFIGFGINNSIALFSNHKFMQNSIDLFSRYIYLAGVVISMFIVFIWTKDLDITILTGAVYLLTNLSHNFKQKLNNINASLSFFLLSCTYVIIFIFFYFGLEDYASFALIFISIISIIFLFATTKFRNVFHKALVLKHGFNRGMPLFLNGLFYQGIISFDLIIVSFLFVDDFHIYAFYQNLFIAILGFTNILSEYIFIRLCKYNSLSELKNRANRAFLFLAVGRICLFFVVLFLSNIMFETYFKELAQYKYIFFIFWFGFLGQTIGIGGGAIANILGKGWMYTKIILICAFINLFSNLSIYLLDLDFIYFAYASLISFFCLGLMSFVIYNSEIKKL